MLEKKELPGASETQGAPGLMLAVGVKIAFRLVVCQVISIRIPASYQRELG